MAINQAATFQPAHLHIFQAEVGATAPTKANIDAFDPTTGLLVTPTGWDNIGLTSIDNDTAWDRDGGDLKERGSRQYTPLRITIESITDRFNFNLIQTDDEGFAAYYGTNGASTPTSGQFDVSDDRTPINKAFLGIYVDGTSRLAFYAPSAFITAADKIVQGTDDWFELPCMAVFTKLTGQPILRWISDSVVGS